MSTHEPTSETTSQFRIRHLLIATAIIAVTIFFLAPYFRTLGRGEESLLVAATAGVGFGAFLLITVLLIPRNTARRRAGPVLLKLRDGVVWKESILFRGGFYALTLLFLINFFSMWTTSSPIVDAPWPLESLLKLGTLGVAATFCFGFVAWPIPDPQLCEHGARWGTVFVPWEQQTDIGWSPRDRFTLQIDLKYVGELTVRVELREQVEAILRTHAAGFIQSPKTSHSKD